MAHSIKRNDLYAIYFLSNSGVVIVFSYFVLLLKERGIGETEIGYIAIPASIAAFLSNALFGRLSDIRGRKRFIQIGLLTSALSSALFILPQTFAEFVLARVLNGIALGIFPASIVGTASDRKLKLGKLTSLGSIGWATGGMIGGLIADILGYEAMFIVSGLLYFIAFLIAFRMNTGDSIAGFPQEQDAVFNSVPRLSGRRMYLTALRKNWMIYLIFVLRHGTANSIWIYWALFLKSDLGLTNTQIGVVQSTNMLTQFVFMSTVTDRMEPKTMVIIGGVASSLSFYLFTLSGSFVEIVASQVVLGFSWAMFYVGGLRSVEYRSRENNIVATGTGLFNASLSLSQIVGPFLAIYFFSISHTYIFSMQVAAVVTLIGTAILFTVYITESRRRHDF